MACLLIGDYASIDYTHGAGMSLMDIRNRRWMPDALQATAPNLEQKLGELAAPHAVAGKLHSFIKRYNFSEQCDIIQWSGDNPNSLAGLTLEKPGEQAISSGTSDTVFGVVKDPRPELDSHTFPNPVDPNTFMCMLCYKNGSLTRQEAHAQRCGMPPPHSIIATGGASANLHILKSHG